MKVRGPDVWLSVFKGNMPEFPCVRETPVNLVKCDSQCRSEVGLKFSFLTSSQVKNCWSPDHTSSS